MSFELSQLDALAAAVDGGSFDAAARSLHVTPSAVSQRIKAFESAVGTVLLQRSKPVAVTEAGRPYLRLARQIRTLVSDIGAAVDSDSDTAVIPIAVNGDSLTTWVLPAFTSVADHIFLDIRREDQDHSARLLREGVVMAAITTTSTPVQGCTATRLGIMRYRAMASPAFVARWFPTGANDAALALAPLVAFDRSDDLQDKYLRDRGCAITDTRRHHVPSSTDFGVAVRMGWGWGMLPAQQILGGEQSGELVDLSPGRHVDVVLYWQQWALRTDALVELADVVRRAAALALE